MMYSPPMWNHPPVQVCLVCLLGRMASPGVVLGQFSLREVIAQICNGHLLLRKTRGSLGVDFSQQSGDYFTLRVGIGIFANSADHPPAINSFSRRPSVRPTELPNIRSAFPATPNYAAVLHSSLLGAIATWKNCYADGYKRGLGTYEKVNCFAAATLFRCGQTVPVDNFRSADIHVSCLGPSARETL